MRRDWIARADASGVDWRFTRGHVRISMTTPTEASPASTAPAGGSTPLPRSAVSGTQIPATVFGLVFVGLAALAALGPDVVAQHFRPLGSFTAEEMQRAATVVVRSLAPPCLFVGLIALLSAHRRGSLQRIDSWAIAAAAVASYVSMTTAFSDWMIDDAAITFAYSENLVRGYGLVLHAGQPPEEAYSSTLWMLMLAAGRSLGFAVDAVAKTMCVACGAVCVWATMRVCTKLLGPRSGYGTMLLAAVVTLGAPFVIWSCSGLEHAFQTTLFVGIVALATFTARPVWPTAVCLSALVLLRPESPLIVIATVLAYALDSVRSGRRALIGLWPLVVAPLATWAALMAFRLTYFGVPFPNPYYAKASNATFLRLLNFGGGSWGYVFDWLSASGAFLLAPLILLGYARSVSLPAKLAIVLALGQLSFVLWAGGDWMGCFRFVSPMLPLLAVAVVAALSELGRFLSARRTEAAAITLSGLLALGTTTELVRFRACPTTSVAGVTAIGREFVSLARRLGIDHPTLAHHDAGGTSWGADIDLIDLGGLGTRVIAQHMNDPEFIRHYLFVEKRPTFIFGVATEFTAAHSGFHRTPEFREQYVPVRFPGLEYMQTDLCHVRRDVVHDAPGVSLVRDGGTIVEVVVVDTGDEPSRTLR